MNFLKLLIIHHSLVSFHVARDGFCSSVFPLFVDWVELCVELIIPSLA